VRDVLTHQRVRDEGGKMAKAFHAVNASDVPMTLFEAKRSGLLEGLDNSGIPYWMTETKWGEKIPKIKDLSDKDIESIRLATLPCFQALEKLLVERFDPNISALPKRDEKNARYALMSEVLKGLYVSDIAKSIVRRNPNIALRLDKGRVDAVVTNSMALVYG